MPEIIFLRPAFLLVNNEFGKVAASVALIGVAQQTARKIVPVVINGCQWLPVQLLFQSLQIKQL
jgi:hypothetical protein